MNRAKQLARPIANRGSPLRAAIAAAGLMALAGCASTPEAPTAALQAAEQARVADYASLELAEARENLTAARSAVQAEKMVLAQRLAEESQANAQLASAKAEAIKAKAVNDQLQKGNETLKQEMQRNPGVPQ